MILLTTGDYYNIDNYGNLVTETELISSMSTTSTTVDVTTTRDFPDEGLLMIDDEIIYYKNKGQTIFNDCARGIDAEKQLEMQVSTFSETTATEHTLGAKVAQFEQYFPTFHVGTVQRSVFVHLSKNFADGMLIHVIKRVKDFYASKGTTRSFSLY